MNTMNRCTTPGDRTARDSGRLFTAALAGSLAVATFALLSAAPAVAQDHPLGFTSGRTFPGTSKHGTLTVRSNVEASVDGKAYRLAPGLRIFNPQNQLVFAHSVIGQELPVRYVIEASTGMLHTVWLLTPDELKREPKKGWFR